MQNHYDVLQVLRSAEQEVIKAAYRILARRYHPDSFDGDKAFANAKMQAINAAYEVLGDPERRAAYDRECGTANADDAFFSEEDAKDSDFKQRWQIASKYCSDADEAYRYLERLSPRLAFSFASYLLETQSFDLCNKVTRKFQDNFLTTYFGENPYIQKFARQLLLCGERKAAKSLNEAVKVLGKSLKYDTLNKVISDEHPEGINKVLYFNVLHPNDWSKGIMCTAAEFLRAMGINSKVSGVWGDFLEFSWNNQNYRIRNDVLIDWLIEHFGSREEFKEVWRGAELWSSP